MAQPRPYMKLPRNKRRDRFVSTRWRVACDTQGRGVFACRHLLPGTPGWAREGLDDSHRQTHADIRFLSQKDAREGVWYSASVSTVDQAVVEWLDRGIDGAIEAMGGSDRLGYGTARWRELARLWGKITRADWERAPTTLGWSLDFAYPHAVRVIAVVEDGNLDPAALVGFVEDFTGQGETTRREPIDWECHYDAIAQVVEQQVKLYTKLGASDEYEALTV